MKFLLVLTVYISTVANAQDSIIDFKSNKCLYNSDGLGKSLGIKMKIDIPCNWDSIRVTMPNAVKSFVYKINDEQMLVASLLMLKLNAIPSDKELDSIYTFMFANDVFSKFGELQSVKKDTIINRCWAEYYFKHKQNVLQDTLYQNIKCYYTIKEDVGIMLTYKTAAFDNIVSSKLYSNYEQLFRILAYGTIIDREP